MCLSCMPYQSQFITKKGSLAFECRESLFHSRSFIIQYGQEVVVRFIAKGSGIILVVLGVHLSLPQSLAEKNGAPCI